MSSPHTHANSDSEEENAEVQNEVPNAPVTTTTAPSTHPTIDYYSSYFPQSHWNPYPNPPPTETPSAMRYSLSGDPYRPPAASTNSQHDGRIWWNGRVAYWRHGQRSHTSGMGGAPTASAARRQLREMQDLREDMRGIADRQEYLEMMMAHDQEIMRHRMSQLEAEQMNLQATMEGMDIRMIDIESSQQQRRNP